MIDRNFRCRLGEIDLVMQDGECLVFVEVRYRKAHGFGSAATSVDVRKQRKLTRAARFFLSRHRRLANRPVRFDVIGIDVVAGDELRIEWIRDAFRPD